MEELCTSDGICAEHDQGLKLYTVHRAAERERACKPCKLACILSVHSSSLD
jgi:hypothetical protein